jgi:mono/diheme cytochrome c family protein
MQRGTEAAGRRPWPAAFLFGLAVLFVDCDIARAQQPWACPPAIAGAAIPVASTPEAITSGRRLAQQSCAECHGETGLGDGPAAAGLNPRPASWRTAEFQTQSDACIFMKLSTGRGAMPPAGRMPEAERWQIVSFIRSLGVN